jgi:hypothetical protein
MGGTCDGVIANSRDRYGVTWAQPTTPIERTFREGLAGGRDDSYLVLLAGANHFAIAEPFDGTTGRAFLNISATQSAAALRPLMAQQFQIQNLTVG